MSYAQSTLEGNLTAAPILKKTKTGKSVCSFSVAVNHPSNSEEKPVSYFEIESWEGRAEWAIKNLEKGTRVLVIGEPRQDRWEDMDGNARSKVKVVADQIRIIAVK